MALRDGEEMKELLHKFGKFYSGVIINFIGIFIFVGILSVVCGDYGWMPNKNIYAISQFVYQAVIPVMIAYVSGNRMCRFNKRDESERIHAGGAIAVMVVSGVILSDTGSGIFGAMILGPISGLLWEKVLGPLVKEVKSGLEMVIRNIVSAVAGSVMAILAFYLLVPVMSAAVKFLMRGVDILIERNLIFLLSVIIEPAKVFFLNNSINHGILIPLGIQQAEQMGESILFLLETNPGPGFGVLLALYFQKREKRKKYAAEMFVEFIGGVHEIYFPEVLSNLWLLLALVTGGAAGNFCFSVLNGAVMGVVSPGSIITVLLVSSKYRVVSVLVGILVSAAVSAVTAMLILKIQKNRTINRKVRDIPQVEPQDASQVEMEKEMSLKIGFVCNTGVGSSAMGAALFRRKLKEMNMVQAEVTAYAADQIPEDLDILVCQKDLKELLLKELEAGCVCTVENLLNQKEYMTIIEEIQKRGK